MLLDEVHEDFPRRVHNIWGLFQKAQLSLETVLRPHSRDPIYLRSLYLFGDRVLQFAYRRGRSDHCWRVFDLGPTEAYLLAARSFAQAGVKNMALDALDDAIKSASEPGPRTANADPEKLAVLESEAKELHEFVTQRSAVELFQARDAIGLKGATPDLFGDDAAPGLEEDFGSQDGLYSEGVADASTSDIGFI